MFKKYHNPDGTPTEDCLSDLRYGMSAELRHRLVANELARLSYALEQAGAAPSPDVIRLVEAAKEYKVARRLVANNRTNDTCPFESSNARLQRAHDWLLSVANSIEVK